MSDQTAIEAATKRLTLALDALEAAAERRLEADRADAGLADRLHAADADRSKLAAELDVQTARARQLEAANRDIARRLDAAMDNIRTVLEAQSA
jgi:Domain of unknown function (DUF4164)